MYIFTRVLTLFACLILSLFLAGCATIVHGTTQEIPVSSEPSGAEVLVDGGNAGRTPCKIEIKRKMDHVVTFQKAGYQEENITVMHVLSGAVAGNILAGGFVGWGVDAASGAQYKLVPNAIHVHLTPEDTSSSAVSKDTLLSSEDRLRDLAALHVAGEIDDDELRLLKTAVLKSVGVVQPAGANLPPDVRVKSLVAMRDKGLITPDEYMATKRTICKELESVATD